jgi:phosphopantothenoylcysteine decarboxylase/phosphopantothenate--cysteine ligase
MAQVLVRNLDDATVERLRRRADAHGRSLEQELRQVLVESARPTFKEALAAAAALRDRLPPATFDILTAIREDRQR